MMIMEIALHIGCRIKREALKKASLFIVFLYSDQEKPSQPALKKANYFWLFSASLAHKLIKFANLLRSPP